MFNLKKNKNLIIVILIVAVIFLFFKSRNAQTVKTVPVKKVSIQNKVVTKTVSATGTIKSKNEADLAFNTTQKITKIYFAKGDYVKKGQLIAVQENLSAANTAQVYKDTRDIALRQKELFERNKDTNKDTLGGSDQYNIKLREYDEQISQAQAQYEAQLAVLRGSYIYAPFDGTILDIYKKEGETATIGETVIKFSDLNSLIFEINIDQEDYGDLKTGMDVVVSLDAFTNKELNGKLADLTMFADSKNNNSFVANVIINDKSDANIALGMTGDAKIVVLSTEKETDALYYDEIFTDEENKSYVWVDDKGYASKKYIKIGIEGDVYTQILEKIDGQIITPLTSDVVIKDGYKIKIVK